MGTPVGDLARAIAVAVAESFEIERCASGGLNIKVEIINMVVGAAQVLAILDLASAVRELAKARDS